MLDIDWHVCDRPVISDIPDKIAVPNREVWYLKIDIDVHGRASHTLVNYGPTTFQDLLSSIYNFYRLPMLSEELEAVPLDNLGLKKAIRMPLKNGIPARFIDLLGIPEGPSRMHLKTIKRVNENTYHARLEPMRKLSIAELTVFNLAIDQVIQRVSNITK